MKPRNYFLLYLLLFFILNLALVGFTKNNYYWDEVVYLHLARNLNQGEEYNAHIEEGFRPVLLPAILSFTQNNFYQHFIIALISVLTLYMAYKLLNYFFSEAVSAVSIIAVSALHIYLFWSSKIMAESLSILIITLSLFFYFKFKKTNNEISLYTSIFFASLSTLSKPLNLAFTIPFLIYITLENKKLIIRGFIKALVAFFIPLIPVFLQGVLYYGGPLGALLFQSQITIEARDYFYYFNNFFTIFSFISIFLILGLIAYNKKLKLFLITLIANFIILQLVFSHNVQQRFILPLFPLLLPFIAQGIGLTIKKLKHSLVFILIVFFVMLSLSTINLLNDTANTKLLINAAKDLKNLPNGRVFCNSVPYCSYFGDKNDSLLFPKTEKEFLNNLTMQGVKYIFLDNYHSEPEYKDFIDSNFKIIFNHQNAYKYAKVYSAEWKEN